MQPAATSVDSLTVFPFPNQDAILAGLKHELPAYITKCSEVTSDMPAEEWWKRNSHDLPKWSKAARQVLLLQPSSAAAEHVFSLLTASFAQNSLNDYVETSIILQYNNRQCNVCLIVL